MSETVVRTSHQSYGNRVATSCQSLWLVPILMMGGIWLLVWNEGHLVKQRQAFQQGLQEVINVPQVDSIDSQLEGKLVHFVGQAIAQNQLQDPIFGVAPEGVLKLKRHVEMFQWVESSSTSTQKNTGGSTETTTEYSYSTEWSDDAVNSNQFEDPFDHENPGFMLFDSITMEADPMLVGAYQLSKAVTGKITWYQNLQFPISLDMLNRTHEDATVYNNQFYFGSDGRPPNPRTPQIGDTRVSFQEIRSQIISVVALQLGTTLAPYTGRSGGSVLLVEAGPHGAAEMFLHAHQALTWQTWGLRLAGCVVIFLAIKIAMDPLSTMTDVLPCVGNFVEAGSSAVSAVVALILSIVVIAVAWLAYRPLFSIFVLALVGTGICAYRRYYQQSYVALKEEEEEVPSTIPTADAYPIPQVEANALPYQDQETRLPMADAKALP